MRPIRQQAPHSVRRNPPQGFLQPEAWILLALVVLVLLVISYLVFSPRVGPDEQLTIGLLVPDRVERDG